MSTLSTKEDGVVIGGGAWCDLVFAQAGAFIDPDCVSFLPVIGLGFEVGCVGAAKDVLWGFSRWDVG
jgi:hypothetical protein